MTISQFEDAFDNRNLRTGRVEAAKRAPIVHAETGGDDFATTVDGAGL